MANITKINKLKKIRGKKRQLRIHPPFQQGDDLVGEYIRDDFYPGYNGQPHSIIVIETEDDEEIGVWRNDYIDKAIRIQNAQPGHYVSIVCHGREFNNDGYEYSILEVEFANPDTL